MADEEKTTNGQKTLGNDPFEGMTGLDFDEVESTPDRPYSAILLPQARHETEEELSQSSADPPSEADTIVEDTDSEPPDPPGTAETGIDPDLGEAAAPPPELRFEPEAESSHLLDELIASIDAEIQHIFGSGTTVVREARATLNLKRDQEQYVIFKLAGAEYAAPAANVREVGEITTLTPLPNVPQWLLGVTNLRGDILSVVDLCTFLDLDQPDEVEAESITSSASSGPREMLIVHSKRDPSLISTGLVVDEVSDIRYLPLDRITEPAAPIEHQIAPYLRGVYDLEGRLLIMLDFERLLLSREMQQFEPI
jgi:purine-binding chemotaxis protein CheW